MTWQSADRTNPKQKPPYFSCEWRNRQLARFLVVLTKSDKNSI